jgi:DNA-binding IclR family transcriptional regulator
VREVGSHYDHQVQPNSLMTVTARVGRSTSKGNDTSGKVWSVYLSEAERQDRALAENWKGDTEGILIFVRMTDRTYSLIFPYSGL